MTDSWVRRRWRVAESRGSEESMRDIATRGQVGSKVLVGRVGNHGGKAHSRQGEPRRRDGRDGWDIWSVGSLAGQSRPGAGVCFDFKFEIFKQSAVLAVGVPQLTH